MRNVSESAEQPSALTPDTNTAHGTGSSPRTATGWRPLEEEPQLSSLIFTFCPNPSRYGSLRRQDWVAVLEAKCSDIPRLMREGFYWDASNIIKEESYIEFGAKWPILNLWKSLPKRSYSLSDKHWTASLTIEASDLTTLYDFDINRLTRQTVKSVSATNQNQQETYGYNAPMSVNWLFITTYIPMRGFNVIYDNKPLEGAWPWPSKEHKGRGDRGNKGADEEIVCRRSEARSCYDRGGLGAARSKDNELYDIFVALFVVACIWGLVIAFFYSIGYGLYLLDSNVRRGSL
ncbi:hypothetical protein F5Y08DRAFT_339419 [Xylaria arbuscula]|nr:hypothetical protein F5Y08DRAFT_339419 [Xylaria arbuscula]